MIDLTIEQLKAGQEALFRLCEDPQFDDVRAIVNAVFPGEEEKHQELLQAIRDRQAIEKLHTAAVAWRESVLAEVGKVPSPEDYGATPCEHDGQIAYNWSYVVFHGMPGASGMALDDLRNRQLEYYKHSTVRLAARLVDLQQQHASYIEHAYDRGQQSVYDELYSGKRT